MPKRSLTFRPIPDRLTNLARSVVPTRRRTLGYHPMTDTWRISPWDCTDPGALTVREAHNVLGLHARCRCRISRTARATLAAQLSRAELTAAGLVLTVNGGRNRDHVAALALGEISARGLDGLETALTIRSRGTANGAETLDTALVLFGRGSEIAEAVRTWADRHPLRRLDHS